MGEGVVNDYQAAVLDFERKRTEAIGESVRSAGNRIGVWLVVGSAAALVLVLNAAIGGKGCDPAILAAAARSFLWSLGLAFTGWVVGFAVSLGSYKLSIDATHNLGVIIDNQSRIERLREKFGDNYQPGGLEEAVDEASGSLDYSDKLIPWLFGLAAIPVLLYAASMIVFVVGAATPLSADGLAKCRPVTNPPAISTPLSR